MAQTHRIPVCILWLLAARQAENASKTYPDGALYPGGNKSFISANHSNAGEIKTVIDRIDGLGGVSKPQATRETRRTSSAKGKGFGKHVDSVQDSEAVGGTSTIGALGAVSQILGLQEIDDALARARRGRVRAQDILDRLEEIRIALLTGSLTEVRLLQLVRMVSVRRPNIDDPKLAEILDEIDLRAKVELAKFGY